MKVKNSGDGGEIHKYPQGAAVDKEDVLNVACPQMLLSSMTSRETNSYIQPHKALKMMLIDSFVTKNI